ncbi:hypothetical protein [Methylobacterium sp. WL6]|uniref:hypothetical protein n=1 Tax=Methylobacterium sp. WL6 TaxID=2603901 RepID=UPI001650A71C|nr:hypothetical protein [Methylobacterium sp. WL6]
MAVVTLRYAKARLGIAAVFEVWISANIVQGSDKLFDSIESQSQSAYDAHAGFGLERIDRTVPR